MITISDVETLNSLVRTELIYQSGLDSSRVRNALSLYGSMLDKNTEYDIFQTLSQDDYILLFELTARESSGFDVSETDMDGELTYFKAYEVTLYSYGHNSGNLMHKLVGKLRTGQSRDRFYSVGIYLESVSSPTEVHEYINNSLWERYDAKINIAIQFKVANADDFDFENLNELKIIKE